MHILVILNYIHTYINKPVYMGLGPLVITSFVNKLNN